MSESDPKKDTSFLAQLLAGTLPTKPGDKDHYEAFGRFISHFADAEGMTHSLARKLSGMDDGKARATFGGMRLKDVIERIRAYLVADQDRLKVETVEEIKKCLTQLTNIAERRHKLVHRGASFFDGALFSTNVMTTRSIENIETETISHTLLTDMDLDCLRIYGLISAVAYPHIIKSELLNAARQMTWRYKHEPPKPPNQQRRKAPEAPKPPPESSRG